MLFHGSNLLGRKVTQSVPFGYQPRFMKWIEFPGLRYSQLPKETRVCINIRCLGKPEKK